MLKLCTFGASEVLRSLKNKVYAGPTPSDVFKSLFSPVSSLTPSSGTSEELDQQEIKLALQDARLAARNKIRSRFHSSSDLIHRLFVCISGERLSLSELLLLPVCSCLRIACVIYPRLCAMQVSLISCRPTTPATSGASSRRFLKSWQQSASKGTTTSKKRVRNGPN